MPWLTSDQIQNYGLWLQSGAIFLTFVGVITSALVTRGVARRRATLDLIMSEQSSELMIGIRQKYLALKIAGHMVQFAGPSQASSNEAATLRAVLNRYELVSIGIKEKTLNSRVYKSYNRSTFVTDWIACKPFVMQRRQTMNNPKIYSEYEYRAKKWALEGENC
jgi:hypothetical protein